MPAVFIPPIVLGNPPVGPEHRGIAYRLFRYLGPQPVGRSVVKIAGVYTTVDQPDQLTLAGLTPGVDYFLGGHEYVISDAVAAALTAAGYSPETQFLGPEAGDVLLAENGNTLILEGT